MALAIAITHPFVSAIPDGGDASLVQPSNWNAAHTVAMTMATQVLVGRGSAGAGAAEEITLGAGLAWSGTSIICTVTGNVTGAASSVDNELVRFDSTTGKVIQGGSGIVAADISGSASGLSTIPGNSLAISATAPTQTASAQAGIALTLTASAAIAGASNAGAAAGGSVTITAGDAARLTSGNANGGDITLATGAGIGTGTAGQVVFPAGTEARPSLRMTESNAGWYRQASGQWAFANGGVGQCTFGGGFLRGLSSFIYQWSSGAVSSGADTGLTRNGAGVMEVNNGTATTYRDLKLRNLLTAGGNGSYIQTPSMTVANLPAAATAGAGGRCFVTDATATTFASTVAGGGANKVPVVSDGTNWLIG